MFMSPSKQKETWRKMGILNGNIWRKNLFFGRLFWHYKAIPNNVSSATSKNAAEQIFSKYADNIISYYFDATGENNFLKTIYFKTALHTINGTFCYLSESMKHLLSFADESSISTDECASRHKNYKQDAPSYEHK